MLRIIINTLLGAVFTLKLCFSNNGNISLPTPKNPVLGSGKEFLRGLQEYI